MTLRLVHDGKKLAYSKIRDVEESIQRSRRLKALLEHLLDCRCASLQGCVERLSLSPKMRLIKRNSTRVAPL
jgi:hypothetical protein